MADIKQTRLRRRAGRRPIRDHLDIIFFVERARRKSGLSVRELTRDRKFIFGGQVTLLSLERSAPVRTLAKESLRRRYGQARAALGLTELPPYCIAFEAHEEVQREALSFLDELMTVFSG